MEELKRSHAQRGLPLCKTPKQTILQRARELSSSSGSGGSGSSGHGGPMLAATGPLASMPMAMAMPAADRAPPAGSGPMLATAGTGSPMPMTATMPTIVLPEAQAPAYRGTGIVPQASGLPGNGPTPMDVTSLPAPRPQAPLLPPMPMTGLDECTLIAGPGGRCILYAAGQSKVLRRRSSGGADDWRLERGSDGVPMIVSPSKAASYHVHAWCSDATACCAEDCHEGHAQNARLPCPGPCMPVPT